MLDMQAQIEQWMQETINFTKERGARFGAMIIEPGANRKVLAVNTVKKDRDVTAHAEVNAIRMAWLGGFNMKECILISTCEPCPMCMGSAVWAEIPQVFYGASIDQASQWMHQIKVYSSEIAAKAWYPVSVVGNVLEEECAKLLEK